MECLVVRRCELGTIGDAGHPRGAGAMGTAEVGVVGLDPVPDHLASAVGADRRQLVDGALEAVEDMPLPRRDDLEGEVVIVPAHLAFRHAGLPGDRKEMDRGPAGARYT